MWGLQEHLTAALIDETRIGNWQRANSGVPKSKQTARPKPFPRPGVGATRQRGKNSPERQAARKRALARVAERKRALAAGEIT